MHATLPLLAATDFPAIRRRRLETLQVNLGYVCNQTCVHCHVNAGPKRTESMTRATVDQVLAYLRASGAQAIDLTGGAPELNPHFRYLVAAARAEGVKVIDRCNLTILDRKSTRLNSSHTVISYAVFCLKKKKKHSPRRSNHRA